METWIIYLALGKLLIYLAQEFPLTQKIKVEFWSKLFGCDLCLGVWIYFILALPFHIDVLPMFGFSHILVLGEFLTGASTSFIVHLISLGWKAKFSSIIVDDLEED